MEDAQVAKLIMTILGSVALLTVWADEQKNSEAADLARSCVQCGCNKKVDESISCVRANAMEDYQAGRFNAAIAGFEHVLKSNPKDYLAHFQLATLLQEQRKDYWGALVHYRLYLDLCPPNDKTTLAADRIEECKRMLLVKDRNHVSVERLTSENNRLCSENNRLHDESMRLRQVKRKLEMENKNLRYLLAKMCREDKGGATNLNAEVKKMLAELRVSDDEGNPCSTPIKKPPLIIAPPQNPDGFPGTKKGFVATRPSTYVVQPGDTIAKIAERFYGSRSKWRDIQRANLTTIPTDGRVHAGMAIKLP